MASLRDIRTRIGATKNTRQITSAMKMVSAAKLRRATESATNARPYQQMLGATLQRVAAAAGDAEEPLLTAREVKNVRIVILGTDRGLCGGFNGTLNRRAEEWLKARKAEGKQLDVWTYGKKPRDYLKTRGFVPSLAKTEITAPKYLAEVTELGTTLATDFIDEKVDEVWIGYNVFRSVISQIPTFTKILPLSLTAKVDGEEPAYGIDYRYEPEGPKILAALLPLYLRTILLQAFLENEAGEYAARMTAMDSATRNANDLIKALTLEYNRGRQAAITKELIEIVSGAEAL